MQIEDTFPEESIERDTVVWSGNILSVIKGCGLTDGCPSMFWCLLRSEVRAKD